MTSCTCVSVGEIDEFYTLYNSVTSAEVPVTCCECGDEIDEGTAFELFVGDNGNDLVAVATCMTCRELRDAFFCNGWIYRYVIEHIHQHIEDMDGEISQSCIADLGPSARDMLCDMIEDYWKEMSDD